MSLTSTWVRAIDPPQSRAYQNGVYMRRFENGMALVNPRGQWNADTVQIEPGYQTLQR